MTDSTNISAEAAVDVASTDDLNSAAETAVSGSSPEAERIQLAQAVVDVPMPNPGETVTITVAPGQTLRLAFDYAAVGNGEVLENGNLVLPVNGGQVILVGFADAATFDPPVELTSNDGTVIELGDFLVAIDVPLDVLVETAAGTPGPIGPLPETTAPNQGAGFTPGDGPAILAGLDPDGPVDPTALQYTVPEREPFIIDLEEGGGVPDAEDDGPESANEAVCLDEEFLGAEGGYGYDFDGFIGGGGILDSIGGVTPPDGDHQFFLTASAAFSVATIESFFGLPANTLRDLQPGEETEDGGAMRTFVTVDAGDTLTFQYNFLQAEEAGDPDELDFMDFAAVVIGDQVFELADNLDANLPAGFVYDEQTGYITFTHTFLAGGTFQIGFAVMNEDDTDVDPALLIDNVVITGPGGDKFVDSFENGADKWDVLGGVGGFISISDNVLDNDSFGDDGPGGIVDIQYTGDLDVTRDDSGSPTIFFSADDGSWEMFFNIETGEYTFTLTGPYTHSGPGEDEAFETFSYTIVDSNGDTDSATLTVCIKDDVPQVFVDGAEGASLDETVNGGDDDGDGIPLATQSFFGFFLPFFDFGTDGPAAANAIVYSLGLTTPGADSGMVDTLSGDAVVLVQLDANTIVGQTADDGLEVFRIVVDPDSGVVTVTQLRALEHDDPDDSDEAVSPETIAANLVNIQVTATDGDGDTTTASADLGSHIEFRDDGPVITDPATESTVSEIDLPNAVTGDIGIDFGSDGVGDVTGISGPTGIFSGGVEIEYDFDAATNTLTGFAGEAAIFTLSIDPVTGQYSFTLLGELDHGDLGSLELNFGFDATDGDDDHVNSTITINVTDGVSPPTASLTVNGDGIFKEDVTNSVHIAAAVANASDHLTTVEIQGLSWGIAPADLTALEGNPSVASVSFVGGTLTITLNPGVESFSYDLPLTPPEDTDVDLSGVTITATAADDADPSATATSAPAATTLIVDAVLDQFADGTQAAAPTVAESAAAQTIDLNLTVALNNAGFANSGAGGPDTDSSEAVTSVTVTISVGTLTLDGYAGAAVLTDNGGGSYTLTGWTDFADLQNAIDALSVQVAPGFDGTVTGQLSITTEEANTPAGDVPASGAEPDVLDNTRTDTTNFSATVTPGVEPPTASVTVNGAGYFKEDVTNSVHITAATGDVSDQLTTVEIQGLTWGVSAGELTDLINHPDVANATFVAGTLTITFEAGVDNFVFDLDLTPPEDTDVDLSGVTIKANVSDESNPAATASFTAAPVTLVVDAVLDDFVDGSQTAVPSVVESLAPQTVDLNLAVQLTGAGFANSGAGGADGDGSEVVSVTVTLSGGTLVLGPGYAGPAIVTDNGGGSFTLSGFADFADLQNAVNALSANLPAGFDNGTISGQLSITTKEANTPAGTVAGSGAEPDVADNTRTDTTDFTLNVTDDGPVPVDDEVTVGDAGATVTNLIITFDRSGSMDEDPGVDGFATRMDLAREAVAQLMNSYNTFGTVNILIVDFAGAPSSGGVANNSGWLTGDDAVLQAIDYLAGLQPDGNTDYQAAVEEVQDAYAGAPAGADQQFVYFISDGNPTVGGRGDLAPTDDNNPNDDDFRLTDAQRTAWENFLTTNQIDDAFAVGVGAGVTNINALEDIAFPNVADDGNPVIVINEEQLLATLIDTVTGGEVTDNVLTNDTFGVDGPDGGVPYVKSIVIDGSLYEYDPLTGNVTKDGLAFGNTTITDIATDFGKLTFNFANGAFTYKANDVTNAQEETFTYTVVDDDGTQATADLIVTINDVDTSVIARDDRIITNIANGDSILIPAAALLFNDFHFDGVPLSITAVANAVGGAANLVAGNVQFDKAANDGSFDYTATASGFDNAHVTIETDTVGSLSGTSGREILIANDSATTINAGDGSDFLIGGAGNDTLNGDIGAGNSFGADVLFGGEGTDTLNGGADGDYLDGGNDGDADTLNGGAGDDILVVWTNDIANGGFDSDMIILKDNLNFGSVNGNEAVDVQDDNGFQPNGGMTNHRGDILVFDGDLNFNGPNAAEVATGRQVSGIETISMQDHEFVGSADAGNDTLTLQAADVISMGTGTFDPAEVGGVYGEDDTIRVDGDAGDVLNLTGGGWINLTTNPDTPAGYTLWAHDLSGNGGNEDAYVLVQTTVTVNAS